MIYAIIILAIIAIIEFVFIWFKYNSNRNITNPMGSIEKPDISITTTKKRIDTIESGSKQIDSTVAGIKQTAITTDRAISDLIKNIESGKRN
jgi:hypothetical protein